MSNRDPWLSQPTTPAEADLAAGLAEARNRLPDEVTLRRLWSKVASPELEQPARSRSRWPWFVGGVVTSSALAVALGIWLMPMRQTKTQLRIVEGSVESSGDPARTAPAAGTQVGGVATKSAGDSDIFQELPADTDEPQAPEPPLLPAPTPSTKAPTMLRTIAGQHRRFRLRGGTVARLSPSSLVSVVAQDGANDRPTVEKGNVAFAVPHQSPGHNFSVTAGPYRIVVIGTKFRLHVEASHVSVSVDEGVVEVWRKHRLVRLASGDSWSSISERGGIAIDGPADGPAEPQVAPPAPAPAPAAPPAQTAAPAAPPAAAPALAPPVAPVDPLREAHAALAAGDNYRALDAYRAVIARGGTPAENAAYEMGGVIRDRLRQPGDAIAAWERYRTQHPNGLLRAEADVSIIETLVRLGDTGSALTEANDFLKRHLDSERRAEIARVAGDLYRERGDCEHAVAAYQTALTASRSAEITQYATFHRAACLVTMGDSGGTAALTEYLHTWPKGRFSREAARLLQSTSTANKSP